MDIRTTGITMSEVDKLWEVLLSIKDDLGGLKQGMRSSVSQRATLFEKVDSLRDEVASMRGELKSHTTAFAQHIVDEMEAEKRIEERIYAIEKDIEQNVKPVTNVLQDGRTKGVAILAALALFGGGLGGQVSTKAQELLMLVIGKGN